ncbi:MAG TPA: MauE/DoxX family redox-associated membrane protein [Phycisphaerae bacterium]|nr:MauE/DoxX family redox-associated membrane protein [Phycisphaerae bacterium]
MSKSLPSMLPTMFSRGYSQGIRGFIACILISSALLKGYSLMTNSGLKSTLIQSHWILITAVEIEWLTGWWLVFAGYPRWAIRTALVLFLCFAGVASYEVVMRYRDCGCFGQLRVYPLFSLTLDIVTIALMIPLLATQKQTPRPFRTTKLYLAGAIVAVALLAGYQMVKEPHTKPQQVALESDQNTIFLEPDTWVHKQLPIVSYVNLGSRLDHGRWTILVYRADCGICRKALDYVERLAQMSPDEEFGLIELPTGTVSPPVLQERTSRTGNCPQRGSGFWQRQF